MAVSEQRDLRQTSLEYILLGETADKDGNEVDLLVVAELRKRDNFRMQRRNGQKGRSLRPSPRELKGLYRSGKIQFVDDGEKRFRDVMEALNVDLDSEDSAPVRKAPAKRAAQTSASGNDDDLQAMTVAQLRDMLKGMGGSIYAGGRQKNKTQLIASIKEMQNGGTIGTPETEPQVASATETEEPMATEPVVDIVPDADHEASPVFQPVAIEPDNLVSDNSQKGDDRASEEETQENEEVIPEPVGKVVSETASEIAEDVPGHIAESIPADIAFDVPAPSLEDEDLFVPTLDIEEELSPQPSVNETDDPAPVSEQPFIEEADDFSVNFTIPSLSFDNASDSDDSSDAKDDQAHVSDVPEATGMDTPDFDFPDNLDIFGGATQKTEEVVEDTTDDVSDIADVTTSDSGDDIDLDDVFAEMKEMVSEEDDVDEPQAESPAAEPSHESRKPSILFNIPADDDEPVDVVEDGGILSRTPKMPVIPVPSRRNRNRVIPKRRPSTMTDTGSFKMPSIVDKISLTDDEPEVTSVPEDEPIAIGIEDDMLPTSSANESVLDAQAPADDASTNAPAAEVDFPEGSFLTDTEMPLDEPTFQPQEEPVADFEDEPIAIQEDDEDEPIAIQEDEEDFIDIFDDLDNEGIATSDDLKAVLSSEATEPVDEVTTPPSYSGFEFAWSSKVTTLADEPVTVIEQDVAEFTETSFNTGDLDAGIDGTSEFDDLDDDLFDDDLTSTYDPNAYAQYRADEDDNAEASADDASVPAYDGSSDTGAETAFMSEADDMLDDLDEPDLDAVSPDGYPISNGTDRGLNESDRTLVRKTFKRMLFAVLIVAVIAIAGIAWLMANGVAVFPSISLP